MPDDLGFGSLAPKKDLGFSTLKKPAETGLQQPQKPKDLGFSSLKTEPEYKGFFGELGESLSPVWNEGSIPVASYIWNHNMFQNLYQGAKRVASGEAYQALKNTTMPSAEEILSGTGSVFKNLYNFAKEHPGALTGEILKSIIADPELLPAVEFTAAKGGLMAAKIGAELSPAAAGAMARAGRVVGGAIGGGTTSAAVEGAQQFKTGDYDLHAIAQAANLGIVGGGVSGLFGKTKVPGAKKLELPPDKVEKLTDIAGNMPGYTARPEPAPGTKRYYITGETNGRHYLQLADKPDYTKQVVDLTPEQEVLLKPVKNSASLAAGSDLFEHITATKGYIAEFENPFAGKAAELFKGKLGTLNEPLKEAIRRGAKSALAGAAIGTALGVALDEKDPTSTVGYAALAGGALGLVRMLPKFRGGDISEFVNLQSGLANVFERRLAQFEAGVRELGLTAAARERITMSFGNKNIQLTPEERIVKRSIEKFNQMIGKQLKDEDLLQELKDDYIAHLVETESGSVSDFAKLRKYNSISELLAAIEGTGMKLKTVDAVEITKIYGRAAMRRIATKQMANELKAFELPGGKKLVQTKSGRDYLPITEGPLEGTFVHKDIYQQVRTFSTRTPAEFKTLSDIAVAAKSASVAFSMFHVKTLYDGLIGALGMKGAVSPLKIAEAARDVFLKGDDNGYLDQLLMKGLKLSSPEDINVQKANSILHAGAEKIDAILHINRFKKISEEIETTSKALEFYTFAYMQNGFKIETALTKMGELINKGIPAERAAAAAASFTNDVFGGIDWFRMFNESSSVFMRKLGNSLATGPGRAGMQIVMFAPDWTFATFRSLYKTLPGVVDDPALASLHRSYLIKSALYYFTVANAINVAFTGHGVWQNKDPTRIDLGNGKTMQFSKHFMEFPEWFKKPAQTFINKLGSPAKFIAEEVLNMDYLVATGNPPPIRLKSNSFLENMEQELEHLVKKWSSISIQQAGNPVQFTLSFLGMPLYGAEDEDVAAHKTQGKLERKAGRREAIERKQPTGWQDRAVKSLLNQMGVL